ncbi:MAG: SCO family protein [Paludibacter sp.]
MKSNFLSIVAVCLLLSLQTAFSQVDQSGDVGVYEHLGTTLPLDLKFANDKADSVTLRQLITKPTILSFVYFDCPGLCSPLLEGVGGVIRKTPDMVLGKDYQVITISFNFRDTPQKAKDKKKKFVDRYSKDHADGWIFLTTDSSTIFKITNATGFKVKAVGMDFVHPSAIIAVSPTGKITRYLYGITYLSNDFKLAIIEAGKEQPRPTIQKLLLMCYSYDPENKRFALDVTKIAGTMIVFFIAVFFIVYILRPKKKNQN